MKINRIDKNALSQIYGRKQIESIERMSNEAELFYQCLQLFGFDESKYENVLELNQGVFGSVSQFLYNQYLLSHKVSYKELDLISLRGDKGHLGKGSVHLANKEDAYFTSSRFDGVNRFYNSHTMLDRDVCDFDVCISRGISTEDVFNLIREPGIDLYMGDILSLDSQTYETDRENLINKLKMIRRMNTASMPGIITEFDSTTNSELILLKK